MKKALLCTPLGSLVAVRPAEAVDLTLSGQISRMVVAPDDAIGSELQFQDIGWSGSRFRFTGTQDFESGAKPGFRYEVQLQSNPSFSAAGGGWTDGGNENFLDNHYQDIWF